MTYWNRLAKAVEQARAALRDTAPEKPDFSWFRGSVDKELVQKLVDMERDTASERAATVSEGTVDGVTTLSPWGKP